MEREPAWKAKRAILLAATAWAALAIVVPFTAAPGSVGDLSGTVGQVENDFGTLNPLAQAVYYLGDLNCHTLSGRSYELNGNQMPFCARDTGLFLGLAVGMAAVLLLNPRFSWLAVILLAAPLVADGGAQLVLDYESTNLLRTVTGVLGGIAAALFLGHLADRLLTVRR